MSRKICRFCAHFDEDRSGCKLPPYESRRGFHACEKWEEKVETTFQHLSSSMEKMAKWSIISLESFFDEEVWTFPGAGRSFPSREQAEKAALESLKSKWDREKEESLN